MKRKLVFFLAVLLIAIAFELLRLNQLQRSVTIALIMVIGFLMFVCYDILIARKTASKFHFLLSLPFVLLLPLVTMGHLIGIGPVAAWSIFAGAVILFVGFAPKRT